MFYIYWIIYQSFFLHWLQLFLVERVGRRTLHLIGLGGMAICALLMTIALSLVVSDGCTIPFSPYRTLMTSSPHLLCFCLRAGHQPVSELSGHSGCVRLCCQFWDGSRSHPLVYRGWALLPGAPTCCHGCLRLIQLDRQLHCGAEFPSTGGMDSFTSLTYSHVQAVWVCHAVTNIIVFFSQDLCGPYVFIIFMVLLILFFIFTFLRVPETKGRTFDDIAQGFAASAGRSAQSPVPDSVAVSLTESKEAPPMSPTEKISMVELPPEKQWASLERRRKT